MRSHCYHPSAPYLRRHIESSFATPVLRMIVYSDSRRVLERPCWLHERYCGMVVVGNGVASGGAVPPTASSRPPAVLPTTTSGPQSTATTLSTASSTPMRSGKLGVLSGPMCLQQPPQRSGHGSCASCPDSCGSCSSLSSSISASSPTPWATSTICRLSSTTRARCRR